MTEAEKYLIVNQILGIIKENSKSIEDLNETETIPDGSWIELSGGLKLPANVFNSIITNLNENSTFAGVAVSDTNPGLPSNKIFYLAGPGQYPNFNNIEIKAGQLGVLQWNGSWIKEVIEFGFSKVMLKDLDSYNSTAAEVKGDSFYKVYNVMYDDSANAGLLFIIGDTFNHVITQIFLTHCVLQDGSFSSGTHDHTQVFLYERTYLNQWSEWKVTYLSKIQETLDLLKSIDQPLPFDGFVSGVNTETVGASTITSVVYDTVKGKFLGKNGLKYYDYWPKIDSYQANTAYNDTDKAKDVLFVNKRNGIVYKGPILSDIQTGSSTVDSDFSTTSTNPVQNKTITSKLTEIIGWTDVK